MAQSYQPSTISDVAHAIGEAPKTSGFYERGAGADGGWGFVIPRQDGTIEVVAARNAALIGSTDEADVRIVGPDVAPQHARVEVRADGVYLEDLGSDGGTYVGGVRARRIGVGHGDIVRFGGQLAVFAERGLARYKGRIDPAQPLVVGPRDQSAFVDPALEFARAGQSFVIEGGPALGKRTLAQMAAGQRAAAGPIAVIDAGDSPAEAVADARDQKAATWILINVEQLPRALQLEIGQYLAKAAGTVAIATIETPLDRATGDGALSTSLTSVFGARRLSIPPLSERRENIPGIVWALARKLGVDASRVSVELIERIARAAWPGGITEIEEVLIDASSAASGTLDAASIQRPLSRPPSAYPSPPATDDPALARERLVDALAKANGSIASAARTLGMSRQAVYREAQRLGLEVGKRKMAAGR